MTKNKEAFIVTYTEYNNYGTKLQNFALCNALQKTGIETHTIRLKKPFSIKKHIKNMASCLPISKRQQTWRIERLKNRTFATFNNNLHYAYYSKKQLQLIDFQDAIVVAGSDQIWSPKHLKKHKKDQKLFFLSFAPKSKRYTYAPSFGVNKIPTDMMDFYKNNLSNIKLLSVREKAGQDIIYQLTGKQVPIAPDPVFLLTPEEWRDMANYSLTNKQKYVLAYFLGKISASTKQRINYYSKRHNCKIISIAGNIAQKDDYIPSPEEFLGLIDNADCVFTDSFHATAFSIIFNTKFKVFERSDVKQFSRIENILNLQKAYGTEKFLSQMYKEGNDYLKSIVLEVNNGK